MQFLKKIPLTFQPPPCSKQQVGHAPLQPPVAIARLIA